jgi:hypothetical protein
MATKTIHEPNARFIIKASLITLSVPTFIVLAITAFVVLASYIGT